MCVNSFIFMFRFYDLFLHVILIFYHYEQTLSLQPLTVFTARCLPQDHPQKRFTSGIQQYVMILQNSYSKQNSSSSSESVVSDQIKNDNHILNNAQPILMLLPDHGHEPCTPSRIICDPLEIYLVCLAQNPSFFHDAIDPQYECDTMVDVFVILDHFWMYCFWFNGHLISVSKAILCLIRNSPFYHLDTSIRYRTCP